MNTSAYRTILISAGLVAASAIAGCDAREEPEPYADERTDPAADPGYAARDDARATDPGTMDPAASGRPGGMTSPQDPATSPGSPADQSSMAGTDQFGETDVVGQTVVSQDGEEIGTIVQVVDDETGQGRLAIVEVGEFLGIGEKQVAIDVRQLSLGADGQVRSNMTEDTLQAMPEYEDDSAQDDVQGQEMAEQGTE